MSVRNWNQPNYSLLISDKMPLTHEINQKEKKFTSSKTETSSSSRTNVIVDKICKFANSINSDQIDEHSVDVSF